MKCEKNNDGECSKNCKYWLAKNIEPERYMCLTLPQGLYEHDTLLIEVEEWERLMNMPKT